MVLIDSNPTHFPNFQTAINPRGSQRYDHRYDLDELKRRVDCREIARRFLLQQPKTSKANYDQYVAPRGERTASFTVYADGFKDFGGSGDSGDHIKLIRVLTDCTVKEAIAILAEMAGEPSSLPALPLPKIAPPDTQAAAQTAVSASAAWQQAASAALQTSQTCLWSDRADAKRVLAYLRHERGLSGETIRAAGLGYNPRWQRTAYVTPEGKAASLAPGIVIPAYADGTLQSLKVRTRTGTFAAVLGLPDDQLKSGAVLPKYIHLTGSSPAILYGAQQIRPGQPLLIVEGEFDALVAQQAGIVAVTLGSASNHLSAAQVAQLQTASLLLACLDQDKAGQKALERFIEALPDRLCPVALPAGKDLTEFVVQHGGDVRLWWQTALAAARPRCVVPDALRHMALYLRLDKALITYELYAQGVSQGLLERDQPLTVADLVRVSQQLALNVPRSTIQEGLSRKDRGADYICWKSDSNLLYMGNSCKDVLSDSRQNQSPCGRTPTLYCMRSPQEVITRLGEKVLDRALEKNFRVGKGCVAPLNAASLADRLALLVSTPDDPQIVAEQLAPDFAAAYRIAKPGEAAYRLKRAMAEVRFLHRLSRVYSTALHPGAWGSGRDYRAALKRAQHEAEPDRAISYKEHALLYGISPSSTPAMLTHAGLENDPDTAFADQTLDLHRPLNPQVQAAARQLRGRACRVRIWSDASHSRGWGVNYGRLESWVESEAEQAYEIAVTFQVVAKQRIWAAEWPVPPEVLREREAKKMRAKKKRTLKAQGLPVAEVEAEAQAGPKPLVAPGEVDITPELWRKVQTSPETGWMEYQLLLVLTTVTKWVFVHRDDSEFALLNEETGELLEYSPKQVIGLLLLAKIAENGRANPMDHTTRDGTAST